MKDSPFEITFDKLQEKGKCSKAGHQFCYLPNGEHGPHLQLDPREWGLWASAINDNRAVIDYPPRNCEFDSILEKHSKSCKKSNKGKHEHDSDSENGESRRHQTIKVINVTAPTSHRSGRRHSDPYSSPVKTTKPRPVESVVNVLELLQKRGYGRLDFVSKALLDYSEWLSENFYPTEALSGSFDILRDHKIGADVLGDVDAVFLLTHCKMPIGDALRITKHYKNWLLEGSTRKVYVDDDDEYDKLF